MASGEASQQMLVKVSYLELYNEKAWNGLDATLTLAMETIKNHVRDQHLRKRRLQARDLLKPEDPDNGKAQRFFSVDHGLAKSSGLD